MNRKEEIKEAYRNLGNAHNVYDGMMTGSTFIGRLIDKAVWIGKISWNTRAVRSKSYLPASKENSWKSR